VRKLDVLLLVAALGPLCGLVGCGLSGTGSGDVPDGAMGEGDSTVEGGAPSDAASSRDAASADRASGMEGAADTGNADAGVPCGANLVCTPAPVPMGWSVVAFLEGSDGGAPCPSGYGQPAAVAGLPGGGSACDCAGCGARNAPKNPCVTGNVSSVGDAVGACPAICGHWSATSDGACDSMGTSLGDCLSFPIRYGKASALPPASVACQGAPATLPPVTFGAHEEVCALGAPAGSCPGGASCVPVSTSGACIEAMGAQACPSGWTRGPYIVGDPSKLTDMRMCSAMMCSCSSAAHSCSNASIGLYADPMCHTLLNSYTADGNCNQMSSGTDVSGANMFIYAATPDTMACKGAAPPNVMGSVAFMMPKTVCCP
jgi:hypothetical protein